MHHITIGMSDYADSDDAPSLVVDGSCTFGTIMAKILENEKTLTGHTKQQPQQNKMQITVFTTSQIFDLEVESSNTLGTILSMIHDQEEIPTSERIVAIPKLLPPHSLDHGTFYYMSWKSVPAASKLIQINVRAVNLDDMFSLEVTRSDTIGNIKDKIFETVRIKPFMQRLYFAGMLLEKDGAILSDYNIHGGSTLDLASEYVGPLEISVEPINGKKVSLQVTSHHEISMVKSLIREKEGLSLDQPLTLVYAGEKLDDRCMLTDYNIQDETTLCLVDDDDDDDDDDKDPMMRIQIYVKIVASGKTISLQVIRSNTIHDVKTMIQGMDKDIPACKQILFLPQKRLKDKSTLAEYYIRDQSTLHLLVYTPEMEQYDDAFADCSVMES